MGECGCVGAWAYQPMCVVVPGKWTRWDLVVGLGQWDWGGGTEKWAWEEGLGGGTKKWAWGEGLCGATLPSMVWS